MILKLLGPVTPVLDALVTSTKVVQDLGILWVVSPRIHAGAS